MATPINNIFYDGFDFAANGIVFTNVNYMTLPERKNQLADRANRDGSVLVQSLLGSKPITLEGFYDGADSTAAQNMYDTLAAVMNRSNRQLMIPHAGGTRTFMATPENVLIQEPDGLNRLTFSFSFVVPDGSAQDSTVTSLVSTTITTANASPAFTIAGSTAARPLISLVFTTVTGGTAATVVILNARDLVGLTYSRNWVSGDTLTIDSANYQVYLNGALIAPSGRFPSWQPGTGALYYSDTFTTRSVAVTMSHKKGNL